MPKFVGNRLPVPEIVFGTAGAAPMVKLSYSQAKLVTDIVVCELDASDRGGPRSMAKRWFRWLARRDLVIEHPNSTEAMRTLASNHSCTLHDDCKANRTIGALCISKRICETVRQTRHTAPITERDLAPGAILVPGLTWA